MKRTLVALLAAAAVVLPALAVLPSAVAQEAGSATVVPLQVNGDPADQLNLVVLGDGYTADDLDKYRQQVDQHLNVLWSIEPFRSYRNYFNVYMIEVVSAESGISCDPDDGNVQRDTALNLGFARTCPADPLARGITFGPGGQDALNDYVAMIDGVTPQNRQTLTLANTDTYGGIGGRNATTSGGAPQGPLITPHELGHSLGGLQDEYPYSARGVPGGPYTGGEPSSIHHTLLTEQEMLEQQAKWWRWLGEESLSGGVIGRYESGQTRSSGIWRPSKHSMMRMLGYYFDQVSRERMTERISGRRDLGELALQSTPTDAPVASTDVIWIETPHPTYHELQVTWEVDGEVVADDGRRSLDLEAFDVADGATVTVTVVDPTDFVRDPAIRDSDAFTATRTWTVGPEPVALTFTRSTPADQPVGRDEVVYVETAHPRDRVLDVVWTLDGEVVEPDGDPRTIDLGAYDLDDGAHELSATIVDPGYPEEDGETRTWTVDAVGPQPNATLSEPLTTFQLPGQPAHHVYNEQFTLALEPSDDQPGHVVGEFRLDRDGWFNYHGWPDAPEGTPFLFTPTGTNIKELVYGNLGTGGMSMAPFEDNEPGYGTHSLEYRAIDAAGNIGEAEEVTASVLPGPLACTTTVTEDVRGALRAEEGVLCLDGATVTGSVVVRPGAAFIATDATIDGTVTASSAEAVQLVDTTVTGTVNISRTSGNVALLGATVERQIVLSNNDTVAFPMVIAGSTLDSVTCSGAQEPIETLGVPNAVDAGDVRRCEGL